MIFIYNNYSIIKLFKNKIYFFNNYNMQIIFKNIKINQILFNPDPSLFNYLFSFFIFIF